MIKFPSPYDKVLPDQIKPEKPPEIDDNDVTCNRMIGSLIGLAIGDALGASVEFRPQQYLAANPVSKMVGGGTWGLEVGKWTDDTSMALCLAASLIAEVDFNPYDQMVRYKWWNRHGYLSSTGHCFDIGQATRQSINKFTNRQKTLKLHYRCRSEYEVDTLAWDSVQRVSDFDVHCGDEDAAGNGALMRLAPVPLFYFKTPTVAIEYAGRSASLTHANQKAIDACRYYAALIVAALHNYPKEDLLNNNFYSKHKDWFGEHALHDDIIQISRGSYKKDKNKGGYEQGIRGKGYIVHALEAALWAFWSHDSFEAGALAAVNLGDDTDTTAAIYGQLAGAHYGYKSIPKDWVGKLYARDLIVCMSQWLYFYGKQRGSEHSEHAKSQGQKQQQSSSASASAQPKTDEFDNKSDKSKRHSKQKSIGNEIHQKPSLKHSISVDSNTNTSTTRITSPSGIRPELSKTNSSQNYDDDDDYTKTTHGHAFYPTNSSRRRYQD
jgi:ADP-ribosyl-[dinitrogen reductase] hydrolase